MLYLTEPDQHGCVKLMDGDTQLAYVNPEGIPIIIRVLEEWC